VAGATNPAVVPERFRPGMERQLERFRAALAGGMPRRGWKIGINVPEVLRRLELPHPGLGWIDGRRVFSDGAELASEPGARLHVEPEVALRLARAVPRGASAELGRDCIGAVHPALEIVDYARPGSGLDDVVAHCMFHSATVLGAPAPLATARGLGNSLPLLRVAARSADPPRSDLVPSDLGELVAFAAAYLSAFGLALEAGDLLLSGAYLAKAAALAAGEQAVAEFGSLGSVTARRGS